MKQDSVASKKSLKSQKTELHQAPAAPSEAEKPKESPVAEPVKKVSEPIEVVKQTEGSVVKQDSVVADV